MTDCNRCGECCKYVVFGLVSRSTKDEAEYFRAHGFIEEQGLWLIPFQCPHLKQAGIRHVIKNYTNTMEIYYFCDIHETKPRYCKDFDGRRYRNHTLSWVPKGCSMAREANCGTGRIQKP